MNEIVNSSAQLPDTLPDLARFVLIGRDKLKAVRAEIHAIDKLIDDLNCSTVATNILIVAEHNNNAGSKIIAKDATVKEYYFNGEWSQSRYPQWETSNQLETLGEFVQSFAKYYSEEEKIKRFE